MLLESQQTGDTLTLRLSGSWSIENIAQVETALAEFAAAGQRSVQVDCSALEALDLSGAWLLHRQLDLVRNAGGKVEFIGQAPGHFRFIDELTTEHAPRRKVPEDESPTLRHGLAWIGRRAIQQGLQTRDAVGFFGRVSATLARSLRSVRHLRLASVTRHVYETGVQAIPIVSLIAFLISVIVAYLGAQQLQQFGAEIYTVDLVAIAVLREMGVLADGDHCRGTFRQCFRCGDRCDAPERRSRCTAVDGRRLFRSAGAAATDRAGHRTAIADHRCGCDGAGWWRTAVVVAAGHFAHPVHSTRAGSAVADDFLGRPDQGAGISRC